MPQAAGLYYEEFGPADAPPLILSAGLGGAGAYWKPNIPALAEQFRVIAYDHRGTGQSDRTLPERVTVDDLAHDILSLMESIGIDQAHVMGHAAGGVAGLALAAMHPERIDRLVVVNGWGRPDPHFARCFDARLTLLRDSGPEAYLRAQPLFLFPAAWSSEHDHELQAELPHQLAGFAGAETYEKRIAALRTFDFSGASTTVPTLLIASRDDMLVPYTASQKLADALPNAQLALMDWGGHACNVTDPETFNRITLDFLRS